MECHFAVFAKLSARLRGVLPRSSNEGKYDYTDQTFKVLSTTKGYLLHML